MRAESKIIIKPGNQELRFCEISVPCSLLGKLPLESSRLLCVNYMPRSRMTFLIQSKKGNSNSSFSGEEMQHITKENHLSL